MQQQLYLIWIGIFLAHGLVGAEVNKKVANSDNELRRIRGLIRQKSLTEAHQDLSQLEPGARVEDKLHYQNLLAEVALKRSASFQDQYAVDARKIYEVIAAQQINIIARINARSALVELLREGIGGDKNETLAGLYETEVALYLQK